MKVIIKEIKNQNEWSVQWKFEDSEPDTIGKIYYSELERCYIVNDNIGNVNRFDTLEEAKTYVNRHSILMMIDSI